MRTRVRTWVLCIDSLFHKLGRVAVPHPLMYSQYLRSLRFVSIQITGQHVDLLS